jgi:hypothetical protein
MSQRRIEATSSQGPTADSDSVRILVPPRSEINVQRIALTHPLRRAEQLNQHWLKSRGLSRKLLL